MTAAKAEDNRGGHRVRRRRPFRGCRGAGTEASLSPPATRRRRGSPPFGFDEVAEEAPVPEDREIPEAGRGCG